MMAKEPAPALYAGEVSPKFDIAMLAVVGLAALLIFSLPGQVDCPNGIMPGEIVHHKTGVPGIVQECRGDKVRIELADDYTEWNRNSVVEFEAMEVIE